MKGVWTMQTPISDLCLAAFSMAKDYSLVGLAGQKGSHREFVFDNIPEDVIMAYYGNDAQVQPRKLFNAFRDLRSLVKD
jgi:hypothetical protein